MARAKYPPIKAGDRFTLLTVIEPVGNGKDNHVLWLCQCDCGNYTTVRDNSLKCGKTNSCGCYRKTSPNKRGDRYRHKKSSPIGSKDRLYRVYWGMKSRCSDGKSGKYYYDRGIRMCEQWEKDYLSFKRWAYENGFVENVDGHTECSIDRIDNDGDYTPENCRWTTSFVQQRNKRSNVKYQYKGEWLIARDIAKEAGLSEATIKRRLAKGMSIEEATTLSYREVRGYGKDNRAIERNT